MRKHFRFSTSDFRSGAGLDRPHRSRIETRPRLRRAGFVLIEVMLGVMIFAMGVLALGKCVGNCITAESARQETERARLALENRMAEVEAGEVLTDQDRSDDLGDSFPGMTLKQTRHPRAAKNENGDIINGLYQVDLEVDWTTDNQPQSRMISFYVLRTK